MSAVRGQRVWPTLNNGRDRYEGGWRDFRPVLRTSLFTYFLQSFMINHRHAYFCIHLFSDWGRAIICRVSLAYSADNSKLYFWAAMSFSYHTTSKLTCLISNGVNSLQCNQSVKSRHGTSTHLQNKSATRIMTVVNTSQEQSTAI